MIKYYNIQKYEILTKCAICIIFNVSNFISQNNNNMFSGRNKVYTKLNDNNMLTTIYIVSVYFRTIIMEDIGHNTHD